MELDAFSLSVGGLVALLVGFSKTGLPGLGMFFVALMAVAFPAKLSVGALLPMLLVGDVFAVISYRAYTQWGRLWGLFPYVMAGMASGAWVLSRVSGEQLRPGLGWLVAVLVSLEILRRSQRWERVPNRWWFLFTVGFSAGFCTTVGNVAGPVMSIYMLSKGLDKHQFMGTGAWFFFLINLGKLPIFWNLEMVTWETLRLDLIAAPLVAGGALAGRRLLPRIPQGLFNWLVLALAAAAALRLIAG